MKSILLAAALLFTAFPLEALSGATSKYVLLPNLFADEYCKMREAGVDDEGSMRWAVRQSMVEGKTITVTLKDGTTSDADVIAANAAAKERCYDLFMQG